ncbi:hypothetical protein F4818DRAFT_419530 [Hypoxylon cercidicola]|nr:hypothetical protein F4818DRAFT_419530 [Hypoxylon cercidicola]
MRNSLCDCHFSSSQRPRLFLSMLLRVFFLSFSNASTNSSIVVIRARDDLITELVLFMAKGMLRLCCWALKSFSFGSCGMIYF